MSEEGWIHVDGTCRVCGSPNTVYLCTTYNEHSWTSGLDNFRCLGCGSVFVANPLSPDELTHAYSTLDEKAYYRETAAASAVKFRRAAQELAELVGTSAPVLDIGAGDGAFCKALAEVGFRRLSAHEIPGADLAGIGNVVEHVYRDTDYSTVPSGAFEVVTMMDVLEHVLSPAETLSTCWRLLRGGGMLYVHTPLVTPLDRAAHVLQKLPFLDAVGRAWQRSRTSVFHLQNYSLEALRQLAAGAGLDVLRLTSINELSWPLSRYVRVYLVGKCGLPEALAPLLTTVLEPLLRSPLNANKAVLVACRPV